MTTLSVALICRDEQENLPAWLESVRPFADEVVAVDSGSRDRTVEILQEAGARVTRHDWLGYAEQRNLAASLCRGEWILYLDADERPDAELARRLNRLKEQAEAETPAAWELAFKVFFFGRFLRHGGFFPEWHLRLHRRGQGRWVRNQVHERLEVDGETGRLESGFVEHYSYHTVGQYLERMQRYSQAAARQMFHQGRRISPAGVVAHAGWNFLNRYLLRLGFLDGYQGYLAARLESVYTLAKYARLRELWRGGEPARRERP